MIRILLLQLQVLILRLHQAFTVILRSFLKYTATPVLISPPGFLLYQLSPCVGFLVYRRHISHDICGFLIIECHSAIFSRYRSVGNHTGRFYLCEDAQSGYIISPFLQASEYLFPQCLRGRTPPSEDWTSGLIIQSSVKSIYARYPWNSLNVSTRMVSFAMSDWYFVMPTRCLAKEEAHLQAIWESAHDFLISSSQRRSSLYFLNLWQQQNSFDYDLERAGKYFSKPS